MQPRNTKPTATRTEHEGRGPAPRDAAPHGTAPRVCTFLLAVAPTFGVSACLRLGLGVLNSNFAVGRAIIADLTAGQPVTRHVYMIRECACPCMCGTHVHVCVCAYVCMCTVCLPYYRH